MNGGYGEQSALSYVLVRKRATRVLGEHLGNGKYRPSSPEQPRVLRSLHKQILVHSTAFYRPPLVYSKVHLTNAYRTTLNVLRYNRAEFISLRMMNRDSEAWRLCS